MDRRVSLRWWSSAAYALAVLVVLLWLAWLLGGLNPARVNDLRTAIAVLAAMAFCIAAQPPARIGWPARALQAVALAAAGTLWARDLYDALAAAPREWDFLCFLLDAKVAGAELNLYDPASYRAVAATLGLELTDVFQREILDVGFKYPPPTALLFLPLAAFDVATANTVWHLLIAASIVGCGVLAAWLLPAARRADALVLGVSLACCLNAAVHVQRFGQTLALLTCLIVLAVLGGGRAVSGAWSAAAVFVKPFMIAPAVLLLALRRWPAVGAGLALASGFIALSVAVLGVDDWAGFLAGRTAQSIPPEQYSQQVNQSLLGVLLRAAGATGTPASNPGVLTAYAVITALLLGASLLAAVRHAKRDFAQAYVLIVVAAMLVYPGTIHYYAATLLVPLVLAFRRVPDRARDSAWWWPVAFVTLTFVLQSRYGAFATMLFAWSALLFESIVRSDRVAGRIGAPAPQALHEGHVNAAGRAVTGRHAG